MTRVLAFGFALLLSLVGLVVQAAPTVNLSTPVNAASYLAPASVNVDASVTASTGTTITQVAFYQGSTLIGSDTVRPYSVTWSNVPAGTYSLTAQATDSAGGVTTSSARTITVNATNTAPTVSLTAPAANATVQSPASVLISASAGAPEVNDYLSKVAFYANDVLIGTVTFGSYALSWTPVAAGTYSLTAQATDARGATTTSAPRTLTVTAAAQKLYYLHTDHLDTPRLVTDETNTIVWRHSPLAEPFGMAPPEEDPDGNGTPFTLNLRFPGQVADRETNTNYNYYRDYNPEIGRYLQSDPIGLQGGINTYAYVGGNPLGYADPYGLNPGTAVGAGFGTLVAPGPGTAVGAVLGTAIGVGIGWWIIESRSQGNGADGRPADVNPGKDCDGKCKPCPPDPPPFRHSGDAHGSTGGFHTHQWRYHQAPDCTCRAGKESW